MEFFRDTTIDFLRYRRFWVGFSVAVLTIGVLGLIPGVLGDLNVGIDFAGGTQLTVGFAERPEIDELRSLVAQAGYPAAQIQRFGEEADNEVMIKTPLPEGVEANGAGPGPEALIGLLDGRYNRDLPEAFDLNQRGTEALARWLLERDPDGIGEAEGALAAEQHYRGVASAILEVRRQRSIVRSWDEIAVQPGVSEPVLATLRDEARLGRFAVLATESVGPQIGRELRNRGILAVVLSLLGMLAYIWVRFELRFGVGALVAAMHDVAIVLGLFALLNYEFNLTTIAALLTVVGYSVNDTVVIFDRVRENRRRFPRDPLDRVINLSINHTLSRTVLTSGTTLLAVGTLFVYGGDVIRGFAFILMVGVVAGTYSTIFIAGPVALVWDRYFGHEAKVRRATEARRKAGEAGRFESAPGG